MKHGPGSARNSLLGQLVGVDRVKRGRLANGSLVIVENSAGHAKPVLLEPLGISLFDIAPGGRAIVEFIEPQGGIEVDTKDDAVILWEFEGFSEDVAWKLEDRDDKENRQSG